MMEQYLLNVRNHLLDALGDHMVASTVFAKRLRTIVECYGQGMPSTQCAESLWDTKFAGHDGYEGVTQ